MFECDRIHDHYIIIEIATRGNYHDQITHVFQALTAIVGVKENRSCRLIFVRLWRVSEIEYRPVTLVMRPIERILNIYMGPQLQYSPKVGSAPRKPQLPLW